MTVPASMSCKVRLPLVEPTQETRREIKAALAGVENGYADFMISGARRLEETIRAVAR